MKILKPLVILIISTVLFSSCSSSDDSTTPFSSSLTYNSVEYLIPNGYINSYNDEGVDYFSISLTDGEISDDRNCPFSDDTSNLIQIPELTSTNGDLTNVDVIVSKVAITPLSNQIRSCLDIKSQHELLRDVSISKDGDIYTIVFSGTGIEGKYVGKLTALSGH